jgi:EmrB/QacA subfamily drug resistance transporter
MSALTEPGATARPEHPDAPTFAEGADPRRWLALGVIAVAQLMVVLDASIVTIALPSAQTALHISDADRQWVVTAYTLAFGGLLLLGGRIADYVGRKRIFVVGLIGFAAASALGGIAGNAGLLFGARALQGAFAALLAPAALSLITVTFTDARERASAFGVYGAISGAGAAIGLILGGVLTEYASWRWCLLVNVPIAIGTAVAALAVVRESKATGDNKYDIPGAVLVTGGLVAIVYGFTEAAKPDGGWSAGSTLGLLIGGVVLLAAFVVVELRSEMPLLPLRIVLNRNRGGAFASALLVSAGLFAMFLFLAFYFQQNLGYSPVKSGLAFLPFSAGVAVAAGIASTLLPRIGAKPLMLAGALLGTVGLASLIRLGADSSYLTHVLPAEILMSVGMGLVFVSQTTLALHGVGQHDAGVASAMLNTSQQIGGALGTALLNTLYASAVTSYLAAHASGAPSAAVLSEATISGYHRAFLVGAIFLAAALAVTAVLVNARKSELAAPEGAAVPN